MQMVSTLTNIENNNKNVFFVKERQNFEEINNDSEH